MKNLIVIALVLLLVLCSRTGPGFIAWDFGGVSTEGIFLCPASGHIDPQTGDWIRDWTNPLAPLFPELLVDC